MSNFLQRPVYDWPCPAAVSTLWPVHHDRHWEGRYPLSSSHPATIWKVKKTHSNNWVNLFIFVVLQRSALPFLLINKFSIWVNKFMHNFLAIWDGVLPEKLEGEGRGKFILLPLKKKQKFHFDEYFDHWNRLAYLATFAEIHRGDAVHIMLAHAAESPHHVI